jgi:hypothetical protein
MSCIGFGGLEVACWPLVPKFAGSNPAEAIGFLRAKKILSTPSFGGEVKPPVPCRRFAACKRFLELRGSWILDEICRNISHPQRVPPSAARGLSRRRTWRHLAEKVGTSKGGGKQWQPTPKNLPRMPEPYWSPDWILVPAKTSLRAEYYWMNESHTYGVLWWSTQTLLRYPLLLKCHMAHFTRVSVTLFTVARKVWPSPCEFSGNSIVCRPLMPNFSQ